MATTHRPARPDDAAGLLEVYREYDTRELGEPQMELSDIEGMLAIDGSERIVAEHDGQIVGYADVGARGEAETVVLPSYDGERQLQRELLDWVVATGAERSVGRLEHFAGTSADGAAVLLTDAGFTHARTIWRMARPVTGELPEATWPPGVGLRPFDRDRDAREVWQVVMTSFAGEFGSHLRPFEEWSTLVLGQGGDVVSAVEDGAVIAVATTDVRQDAGHVGQLAVLPQHRGRGLGLALLQECFRRDAAAGLTVTTLTVDGGNVLARRLYEKAGMAVVTEYRRWERDV
ncbi:MAG: GNAT family N-acetyltransferase [Actinomycetota bacterium]